MLYGQSIPREIRSIGHEAKKTTSRCSFPCTSFSKLYNHYRGFMMVKGRPSADLAMQNNVLVSFLTLCRSPAHPGRAVNRHLRLPQILASAALGRTRCARLVSGCPSASLVRQALAHRPATSPCCLTHSPYPTSLEPAPRSIPHLYPSPPIDQPPQSLASHTTVAPQARIPGVRMSLVAG